MTTIALDSPPHRLRPADSCWPREVEALSDPPRQLTIAGELCPGPRVAIVGTRRADREAERFAFALAAELTRAGFCVVSGGATGIDAAAHRGALSAGKTIAVLASGVRKAFPSGHAGLFGKIARAGALISEYEDGRSYPSRFLERNRIIAALSDATLVVQAPLQSGALNTAKHCRDLGRPLFVVPASPWDPRSAGNLTLLPEARPCRSSADVLEGLGQTPIRKPEPRSASLAGDLRRVAIRLSGIPRHVDELCRETGLDVATVQRLLLELVLLGEADERQGHWVATGGRGP